ncbi:MAG: hypothetical protein GXO19_03330 [Epsilonproteobacteria bacterium]|nr:hypothetical protein [Campylobacterota bacterium]NPA56750.1 hypothetical protein [Campylobacterota bacterium]
MRSYTTDLLGPRVYTQVKVYLRDPQNSVLIKDAVNAAILQRFGSRVAGSRENASSSIEVRIRQITFTPLEYDYDGYVIYYRAKTQLQFIFERGGEKREIITEGFYDFPIEPNSVITDSLRFVAIKRSAAKAIDRFISRLARMGAT